MARLAESSQTVVSIVFLVMNLERLLAVSFLRLFAGLFSEPAEGKIISLWPSSLAANECCWAMA